MAKGTFLERTKAFGKGQEAPELDWAGNPIRDGRGYGGYKAEEEAAERKRFKDSLRTVSQKAHDEVKAFWAKLKADPIAYARHIEKMKAGMKKKKR